ncbi:hypothetical protein BDF20DRAFT_857107 [Mycotypha africana]|uniref:uncharacterized protein n=1 Tax=Mycotypha africana TaxID=64632 RepID=UPI0023014E57|nr:uncharacterized protein BDF20DRAFT_857107 [Mycotypha africana]KAI8983937.1 hypothetical protein BDF20DRAFT_857107 [Mycotypha africana]
MALNFAGVVLIVRFHNCLLLAGIFYVLMRDVCYERLMNSNQTSKMQHTFRIIDSSLTVVRSVGSMAAFNGKWASFIDERCLLKGQMGFFQR